MYTFISALIGYLIGSVNYAVIFSKIIYGNDIRNTGSGNPGATNAVRIFGKKFGIAIFLCDFSKGLIAVAIAKLFVIFADAPYESMLLAGFFAQFGHVLPVFHRFRGGKGVATAAGAATCIMPLAALILIAVFILVVAVTKIVSLSSRIRVRFVYILPSPGSTL